jgi:uncharacterized OB-fold protein
VTTTPHEVLAEPTMAFRLLPRLDDLNRPFWTGGEHGELQMLRCGGCGYWIHPPSPRCPVCFETDVAADTLSGRAVLHTYTVNHQAWIPGIDLPYLVAIVELPEQEGLRLTTNLVGCEVDDVRIGMPLEVVFEHHDDVWLPLFRPAPHGGGEG